WQTEVENRPVPQLAGQPEMPAMGFYDGFTDGQPHTGSVHLDALVSPAIEFFEYQRLFESVDPGPAVSNIDGEHLVLRFGRDADRGTGGGGHGGVFEQGRQEF